MLEVIRIHIKKYKLRSVSWLSLRKKLWMETQLLLM